MKSFGEVRVASGRSGGRQVELVDAAVLSAKLFWPSERSLSVKSSGKYFISCPRRVDGIARAHVDAALQVSAGLMSRWHRQGFQTYRSVQIQTRQTRTPAHRTPDPWPDPMHVPREPDVRCTSDLLETAAFPGPRYRRGDLIRTE